MIKYLLLVFILFCACNNPCYKGVFLNITDYPIKGEYEISPGGIKVFTNGNQIDLNEIDLQVFELEKCLSVSIDRDCFVVYIPTDWYVSTCSSREEQLIPSTIDYRLCEAKGLVIEEACRNLKYPTEECPCVCNCRACIQDNNVIITTPNLKLFKMPLARIVLYPEYVLDNEEYIRCL